MTEILKTTELGAASRARALLKKNGVAAQISSKIITGQAQGAISEFRYEHRLLVEPQDAEKARGLLG